MRLTLIVFNLILFALPVYAETVHIDEKTNTITIEGTKPSVYISPVMKTVPKINPNNETSYMKLQNEKFKAQAWNIVPGMTKDQVLASQQAARSKKYTDKMEGNTGMIWIWEYNFETENFYHTKKIYLGKSTKYGWNDDKVLKEENTSVPKTASQ